MSLREKLEGYSYTALTQGGYQWLRKALHPAESTIKAPRIPSHGIKPTATQEIISTFVVEAPPAAEADPDGTWDMMIAMKNDPLCPMEIVRFNSVGETNLTRTSVINQAYAGGAQLHGAHTKAEYETMISLFQDACEQYRQTCLSITGAFVGATLTDQGSVIAAQVADPAVDCVQYADANPEFNSTGPLLRILPQVIPASDTLVLGTSPYVVSAREGFYMPMKMTDPEVWHSTDDVRCMWRANYRIKDVAHVIRDEATPYPASSSSWTPAWLPPLDNNLGVIWCKGLARTTTFRMTLRIGLEMMTRPLSGLATFTEPPALPDDHAMAMYYEIASRMRDAYPSKDNETGSLWEKIKRIAGTIWDVVSPALAMTPLSPIVSVGNGVRDTVRLVEKVARKSREKKNAKKNPGQAQLVSKAQSAVERAAIEKGSMPVRTGPTKVQEAAQVPRTRRIRVNPPQKK